MSNRSIRWLRAELPGLVSDDVLDEATADRLRTRYPTPSSLSGSRLRSGVQYEDDDGQPVGEWLAGGGPQQPFAATAIPEQ